MRIVLFIAALSILCACGRNSKGDCDRNRIRVLLRSDKASDLVAAFYQVGECRDTVLVGRIFRDDNDDRVSHEIHFKGISIYQSKMVALWKISGLEPPHKITYKRDSAIISFYYKWASDNKLTDRK